MNKILETIQLRKDSSKDLIKKIKSEKLEDKHSVLRTLGFVRQLHENYYDIDLLLNVFENDNT